MSAITPLYKFFSDPIIDNFFTRTSTSPHYVKGLCNWLYISFFIYQGKDRIHEIRLVTERAKCCFSLHAF